MGGWGTQTDITALRNTQHALLQAEQAVLIEREQAQKAAEAVEVAAAQGMFWQMHDTLFEHQQALDDASLVEYALNLGINMPRFLWKFSEHVYASRVQADFHSGVESGVTGTPTFFINGVRLHDGWELDTLLAAIKEARGSQSK